MKDNKKELISSICSVWDVLYMAREDCIPEGKDQSYDEQWDELCEAMVKIHEALNLEHEEIFNAIKHKEV